MRASSPYVEHRRSGRLLLVLAIALAVAGTGFIAVSILGRSAPPPAVHEAGSLPAPTATGSAAPAPARVRAAVPVSLEIPRIKVSTRLLRLGLNPDRTLQVPPPNHADLAGWYDGSVPPGDRGSAVIAGHVDSDAGPAVFYNLSVLEPGDTVRVQRSDRRTATFRVDRIASFRKSSFPTRMVYGQVKYAGLRLITCGGSYIKSAGGYQSNTVVFASLVHLSKTR